MAYYKTDFGVMDKVVIAATDHADATYNESYRELIGSEGQIISIVLRENDHSYVVATNGHGHLPFKEHELEAA